MMIMLILKVMETTLSHSSYPILNIYSIKVENFDILVKPLLTNLKLISLKQ